MVNVDRNKNVTCYKCNKELEFVMGEAILRHEECPNCRTPLKCCKMCLHFDKLAYNQCREINAERTVEKEKPNFCSYFCLTGDTTAGQPSANDLLKAASSIFKD